MSDRLSIGVVCYPSLGGSGVVAAEIAAAMASRGHDVHLFATAPPRRGLPESPRLHLHAVTPVEHPVYDHPPYTMAVAGRIVEVGRRQRLDIVHSHYAIPHAAAAWLAGRALAAGGVAAPKLVTTLHGTDVTQLGSDAALQSIAAFAVTAGDAVTVPSAFLRGAAVRTFTLPEASIDLIPNFVDTDHFAPAQRRDGAQLGAMVADCTGGTAPRGPFLVHVSNFRPVKRAADLLTVLALLRERLAVHLVMVGDGPQLEASFERAERLGLSDSVTFVGEQADVAGFLRHADALLLTSESESFGVAALEAMSCGVPVFAYDVGGLAEVVGDDCGVLVPPFDAKALAAAVAGLLDDEARRRQMGRAARRRAVEHFRAAPILDRWQDLYRRLAAQG